jgi:hypothetical protein
VVPYIVWSIRFTIIHYFSLTTPTRLLPIRFPLRFSEPFSSNHSERNVYWDLKAHFPIRKPTHITHHIDWELEGGRVGIPSNLLQELWFTSARAHSQFTQNHLWFYSRAIMTLLLFQQRRTSPTINSIVHFPCVTRNFENMYFGGDKSDVRRSATSFAETSFSRSPEVSTISKQIRMFENWWDGLPRTYRFGFGRFCPVIPSYRFSKKWLHQRSEE